MNVERRRKVVIEWCCEATVYIRREDAMEGGSKASNISTRVRERKSGGVREWTFFLLSLIKKKVSCLPK